MRKNLSTLCVILYLLCVCSVLSVTKTWSGPDGGKWYHPGNWDPPGVPTTDDNVIIPYTSVVNISNAICHFDYMDNWGTIVADSGETAILVHGGPLRNHHKIISHMNITFRGPELKNEIDAKIVCSKEVNFFANIIENEGFIGFDSTETEEWDTTSPNFMRLTTERIFKNAGRISWPDKIEIHSDSAINDPSAIIESGKSISISADYFENKGDIIADEDVHVFIKKHMYNSGSILLRDFIESVHSGQLSFSCWNPAGDALFTNEGEISGGDGRDGEPGDNVFIVTDNFHNTGTISTGVGGSGSTMSLYEQVSKSFENTGSIFASGSYRGPGSPFVSSPGYVWIRADQINLNMPSGNISGGDVEFWGRVINSAIGSYNGVYGSTLVEFRTTNDASAVANFSSTTITDAIRSLSLIQITSNYLIQPLVGINEICNPDPSVSTGSINFSYGHIFADNVTTTTATSDSLLISVRNSSSRINTLRTVVNSSRGWVISDADTFSSLEPWECRSFYVKYTIPSGLSSTTSDTLSISLYLNESAYPSEVLRPTITFVPLESGSVDISETNKPVIFSLSAHPNPFNSAVRIGIESGDLRFESVEIFDLKGRMVAQLPGGGTVGEGHRAFPLVGNAENGSAQGHSPTNRQFTWQPAPSLSSGVYLVRARVTGGAAATKRVVYLK